MPTRPPALERVVGVDAERVRDALAIAVAVVGDVHEADERLDLEVVEPVAGGVAHPRELLVGRRGRQRLRDRVGVVAVAASAGSR